MNRFSAALYDSPLGQLVLVADERGLCGCWWRDMNYGLPYGIGSDRNGFISMAEEQLDRYFTGEAIEFAVPLSLSGTPFQQSVWAAARSIPHGKVTSYSILASGMLRPKAVRAVASALAANRVLIFVPCHRVIGSNGNLCGYAGSMDRKRQLLELEGVSL